MEAGLGLLRLAPSVFWAMTPRELEAALRGAFGMAARDAPLARAELAALMDAYPDIPAGFAKSVDGRVSRVRPEGRPCASRKPGHDGSEV